MTPHHYSHSEKRDHLECLVTSMEALEQAMIGTGALTTEREALRAAIHHSRRLLIEGFTQEDLNLLEVGLPDPLGSRHNPRWEPPLEKAADGMWKEADWYLAFAAELEAFVAAASALRTTGYY